MKSRILQLASRNLRSAICLLHFAFIGLGGWLTAAAEKPNLIFILADDLGYGDLGSYGQKQIQTPNLDRLAAQGLRFTQAYAGATVCAPSRCVLMTGLHVGHAQVRGNKEVLPMGQRPLDAGTVTLARVLHDAGYATALIGKWGLGGPVSTGHPNQQGFDHFFGYLCQRHAHNYYPEFLFRNSDRVPLPNQTRPEFKDRGDGAGVAAKKAVYAPDLIFQEAFDWVRQHKQGPFFLCLTPTLPHANNEGGDDGMEIPDYGIYQGKDWPRNQKGLAAMISRLDLEVGRLADLLEELGLAKNTLVLFSSDNGPHKEGGNDPAFFQSSGGLRGTKRDLYEGGIRVPLIAWWPGSIQAGRVTDHIAGFQDILPTFTQLASAVRPKTDGLSLVPTLMGQGQQEKHPFLYWEFHELDGRQAIRWGDWKAVRLNVKKEPNGPLELYDLKTDPAESKNVAADHPELVRKLSGMMKEARTDSPDFKF